MPIVAVSGLLAVPIFSQIRHQRFFPDNLSQLRFLHSHSPCSSYSTRFIASRAQFPSANPPHTRNVSQSHHGIRAKTRSWNRYALIRTAVSRKMQAWLITLLLVLHVGCV